MGNEAQLTAVLSLRDAMSGPLQGVIGKLGVMDKAFDTVARAGKIAIGGLTAGFIVAGKSALDTASKLEKLSNQTGISYANLQKLGLAAKGSGSSLEQMAGSLRTIAGHAHAAAEGNKEAAELFRELGISISDSAGNLRDAEDLFQDFADVIKNTSNPTERMALATKLLGRSGTELIPLLAQGSKGIMEMGNAADKAGLLMSDSTIKSLDKMGNQLSTTKDLWVNMAGNLIASTGITVPKLVGWFMDLTKIIDGWRTNFTISMRVVKETFGFVVDSFKIGFGIIGELASVTAAKMAVPFEKFFNAISPGLVALRAMSKETAESVANSLSEFTSKGAKTYGQIIEEGDAKVGTAIKDYFATIKGISEFENKEGEERSADLDRLRRDLLAVIDGSDGARQALDKLGNSGGRAGKVLTDSIGDGLQGAIKDFTKSAITWREAWGGAISSITGSMSNLFQGLAEKGAKWKDLLKSFFTDIKRSFIKMLSDLASQAIMQQVLGGVAGLLGGGGGGQQPMVPTYDPRSGVHYYAPQQGGGNGNVTQQVIGSTGALGGIGSTSLGGSLTVGGAMTGLGIAAAGYGIHQAGAERGNVTQSTLGGAVAGAALGATIGSVIPGVGTVIGGAVGFVVGGVAGFFRGRKKKKKLKKKAAAAAAAAQSQADQDEAARLLTMDVQTKLGGGMATEQSMDEVAKLLSGGVDAKELESFGGVQAILARKNQIEAAAANKAGNTVNVGAPQITVNASVSGDYDVRRLAEQLGYFLDGSIRSAAAGASPGV